MFWALGLGHLKDSIQGKPTRLGKMHQNGKVRTIRVEMRNEREVGQIMNCKYDLKGNKDFWNVFLNNDLSKAEREKEFNERKNRNSRKLENAAKGKEVQGGKGDHLRSWKYREKGRERGGYVTKTGFA